jgi:uncharacterized ubiquitin-like protein YukD
VVVDDVIVTLVAEGKVLDMELPAHVRIEKLKPHIAEALTRKGIFISKSYCITCNSRVLTETDSLYNQEIWDGSILSIS